MFWKIVTDFLVCHRTTPLCENLCLISVSQTRHRDQGFFFGKLLFLSCQATISWFSLVHIVFPCDCWTRAQYANRWQLHTLRPKKNIFYSSLLSYYDRTERYYITLRSTTDLWSRCWKFCSEPWSWYSCATKSLKSPRGLKIPQNRMWLSIYGMCLKNDYPGRSHVVTNRRDKIWKQHSGPKHHRWTPQRSCDCVSTGKSLSVTHWHLHGSSFFRLLPWMQPVRRSRGLILRCFLTHHQINPLVQTD